jgi:GAF domain-containing protein
VAPDGVAQDLPQLEFSAAEVKALANTVPMEERQLLHENARRIRELGNTLRQEPATLIGKEVPAEFLQLLLELVHAERGVIGERPGCSLLHGGAIIPRSSRFAITRVVLQSVLREGKYVFSNHAAADPRFTTSRSVLREQTGSLMAIPLIMEEHAVGYLYIDALDQPNVFRVSDLCLLAFSGEQMALVLAEQQLAEQLARNRDAAQPLDARTEEQLLHDVRQQAGFFRGNKREKRVHALAELGHSCSSAGLSEILTAVADKDAIVAAAAVTALTSFGSLSFPHAAAVQFCERVFEELQQGDASLHPLLTEALEKTADQNPLVRIELLKRLKSSSLSPALRNALSPLKDYFERRAAVASAESEQSLDVNSRPKVSLVELQRRARP